MILLDLQRLIIFAQVSIAPLTFSLNKIRSIHYHIHIQPFIIVQLTFIYLCCQGVNQQLSNVQRTSLMNLENKY